MNEEKIIKTVAADGTSVSVILSGTLSIEDAAGLHGALVDAMGAARRVILDARRAEAMDMTILQTVCSACKTAADKKISFLYEDQLPGCMKTLSDAIGAQPGSVCRQNNNAACIWFGGGK